MFLKLRRWRFKVGLISAAIVKAKADIIAQTAASGRQLVAPKL